MRQLVVTLRGCGECEMLKLSPYTRTSHRPQVGLSFFPQLLHDRESFTCRHALPSVPPTQLFSSICAWISRGAPHHSNVWRKTPGPGVLRAHKPACRQAQEVRCRPQPRHSSRQRCLPKWCSGPIGMIIFPGGFRAALRMWNIG